MTQITEKPPERKIQEPILNEKEAAEFLGIKKRTLQNLRNATNSTLPVLKVGKFYRYLQSSLIRWAETTATAEHNREHARRRRGGQKRS